MMFIKAKEYLNSFLLTLLMVALIPVPGCSSFTSRTSSSNKSNGFSAGREVIRSSQLIALIREDAPKLFAEGYLEEAQKTFEAQVGYIGAKSGESKQLLRLMRQYIYLEVYKVRRTEYLMMNFVKALALRLNKRNAVEEFSERFSAGRMMNYPHLLATRNQLLELLENNWNDQKSVIETRQFLQGSLEAAYISRVILRKRLEFTGQRFEKSDSRYTRAVDEIKGWQTVLKSSNSLMLTEPFMELVEPYFQREALNSSNIREDAINKFNRNFEKFSEDHRKLDDLADYVSGDELLGLGLALARSLKVESQVVFRSRIQSAFDLGVEEILGNLRISIDEHWSTVNSLDLFAELDRANNQTKETYRAFPQFLIKIFREQAIHWIITEDFDYLQKSVDTLTSFASEEMNRQKVNRQKRYVALAAILAVSPLATMKHGGWLGKTAVNMTKFGFFAAEAALTVSFMHDAYKKYVDWRNVQRLVRLSAEGTGLNSIVQENAAYWSMVSQFAISGFSMGMSVMSASKFFAKPVVNNLNKGFIKDVARATWNDGAQFTVTELRRDLKRNVVALIRSMRGISGKPSSESLRAIASDFSIFATQAVVMPFSVLPKAVKSTLETIPSQIYQGASLGAVMAIMGVTVQHYITAAGLKMFTYAFEKLGFTPPTVWTANGLNAEEKSRRDIMINASSELSWMKLEIAKQVGMAAVWEKSLNSGELSESQKLDVRAAIDGSRASVDHLLRLQLVRWYKRKSYRSIYNSVMKSMGFGLIVTPTMENPDRMVITVRVGSKLISYTLRASQVEHLMDRMVDFGDAYSTDELKTLSKLVGVNGPDESSAFESTVSEIVPR